MAVRGVSRRVVTLSMSVVVTLAIDILVVGTSVVGLPGLSVDREPTSVSVTVRVV